MAQSNSKTVTVRFTQAEVIALQMAITFSGIEDPRFATISAKLDAAVANAAMGTGDAKLLAQDRQRAEASVAALERVVADPTRVLITHIPDSLANNPSFMPAIEAELTRMRTALANPEMLRQIYHRYHQAGFKGARCKR